VKEPIAIAGLIIVAVSAVVAFYARFMVAMCRELERLPRPAITPQSVTRRKLTKVRMSRTEPALPAFAAEFEEEL